MSAFPGRDDRGGADRPQLTIDSFQRLVPGLFLVAVMILAGCQEPALPGTPGVSTFRPQLKEMFTLRFSLQEILGFVAGFGTTFAAVPDMLAMFKRRSTAGMNPRMAAIMGCFQVVWVYYGLLIASRPVVLWNVIAVATNLFTVGAYWYFVRHERERR